MAAQDKVTFKQDLTEPVKIRHYEGVVFTGDDCGNLIKVALFDGGAPYSGGGTVSATAVLADGTTFPLTQGSITGNMVSVPLEAGALVVSGLMGLYVKISGNGIICTVLNAIFTVQVTDTGRVPAATVTTVNELVQEIKDAQDSFPADLTNLLAAVAPTFSTSTAYSAGAYVWQGGKLYRFTAAHPAGTWTGTDAVTVALGDDVADLKSASTKYDAALTVDKPQISVTTLGTGYITKDGVYGASSNWTLAVSTGVLSAGDIIDISSYFSQINPSAAPKCQYTIFDTEVTPSNYTSIDVSHVIKHGTPQVDTVAHTLTTKNVIIPAGAVSVVFSAATGNAINVDLHDLVDIKNIQSALDTLAITPELRNGSVGNGENSDAVAVTNIMPINNVKSGNITIKRELSANADHYLVRLNAYSVSTGKTGYNTSASRTIADAPTVYGQTDYNIALSIIFESVSNLGWAFDILEVDTEGNYIPLRITDFNIGDVIVTLNYNDEFNPLDYPTVETVKALADNYDVGFNHFIGKYISGGIYPLNNVSPLTFSMTNDGSVCVIVPVGETEHLRYRSNQLAKYVYSYDADLNFVKRSNENSYAIDFVQNGYVVFRYLPENFNADTLMIAYTDETSGATTDKWDSLFPEKEYEPYTLIPKIAGDIENINAEITELKTALTEDDFIEQISKVSGVTITADANTGDKVAAFTATSATKNWAQLSLSCKPMTAYLLEFKGRCDFVDYSSDYTHGAMLIIEFLDSEGNKIGEKYNANVLGVGGRRYHRCGAVSPYGATTVKLRVVTRIDGSMELSNVSLRPVYGYQSRSTNGVQFDDHLGCIFTAPRNTMPSFEQAKIAGYNTVICNVKFTKPTEDYPVGVPVVIHNQTIDATSDGTGEVSSYTYAQLQEFDFGSWFNKAYTGTKIPTLEEVLCYLSANGMRPAISLHGDQTNEQLDIVAELFAKYCVGKCLIKSFSRDTVRYMCSKLGKKGEYVWDKTNAISSDNVTEMINAFDGTEVTICIETDANYVTAESVALAHAQNVQVGAYNVYDTAQLRKVMMMGVDRITMDFFSDVVVPVN